VGNRLRSGSRQQAASEEDTKNLFKMLATTTFSVVPKGALASGNLLTKYNFEFIEQKRLSSKILTMLSRDYSELILENRQRSVDIFRVTL